MKSKRETEQLLQIMFVLIASAYECYQMIYKVNISNNDNTII